MRARSVVAAPREPPIAVTLAGGGQERTGPHALHFFLYSKHYTRDRFLSPPDDDR